MSAIYELLGMSREERVMVNTVGENVLYEKAAQVVAMHQMELDRAYSVFVERTTEAYSERYKLAGSGRLQRRGGQTQSAVVRGQEGWDVAYPLEQFGEQIAGDRHQMGYSTMRDLDLALDTVMNQNIGTVRYELLRSLFNNTARSFNDPWARTPTLTIQPLANGDAVEYPPIRGTDTMATADHYRASGYASAAISNTNDPVVESIDALQEYFGAVTGGSQVVVFHNSAETGAIEGLDATKDIPDRFITVGANNDSANMGFPQVPGKVWARHSRGAWICEWQWIPAGYTVAIFIGAEKPLLKRVHPAETGLSRGLSLIRGTSDKYPFSQAHYEHDFGFGVANRLNGFVMQLTAGAYAVPTDYA